MAHRPVDGGPARPIRRALLAGVLVAVMLGSGLSSQALGTPAGPRGALGELRTESVTPGGGNWSRLPPSSEAQPFGRASAAVAFDAVGTFGVLYGGEGTGGRLLHDTWVNDGDHPGEWSNFTATLTSEPPELAGATLVYDATDGAFLLFGGGLANGSAYGGTWELRNFTAWVEVPSPVSPPAAVGASAAYDGADGYVVLYDPAGNGSTWKFVAQHWSVVPTSTDPPARRAPALVYDPAERSVVLFGGESAAGPRNDTWEYSGGSWRTADTSAPGPPPSAAPAATYDPRSSGVILYEGTASTSTWEFGSGGWGDLWPSSTGAPPARSGAALYYDPIVNCDLLFGGSSANDSQVLSDVWGWVVPPAVVDPTLAAAPFSPEEVGLIAAAVGVPIAVGWLLRRRPPRKSPVSAPRTSPSAAPLS